jgi:hypothetical protein
MNDHQKGLVASNPRVGRIRKKYVVQIKLLTRHEMAADFQNGSTYQRKHE